MSQQLNSNENQLMGGGMGNGNGNGSRSSPTQSNGSNGREELRCDDCTRQGMRALRWCAACSSAICDACVLDRHNGHEIGCYQKASRDSKARIEDLRRTGRDTSAQLRKRQQALNRSGNDLTAAIDTTITKVKKRANEGADVLDTMKKAYEDLEKLARAPLNGRTVRERRHAATSAEALIGELIKKQLAIRKQLDEASRLTNELCVEMNELMKSNREIENM